MNQFWMILLGISLLYFLFGGNKKPKDQAKAQDDFSILAGQGAMYPLAGAPNVQGDAGAYNMI